MGTVYINLTPNKNKNKQILKKKKIDSSLWSLKRLYQGVGNTVSSHSCPKDECQRGFQSVQRIGNKVERDSQSIAKGLEKEKAPKLGNMGGTCIKPRTE